MLFKPLLDSIMQSTLEDNATIGGIALLRKCIVEWADAGLGDTGDAADGAAADGARPKLTDLNKSILCKMSAILQYESCLSSHLQGPISHEAAEAVLWCTEEVMPMITNAVEIDVRGWFVLAVNCKEAQDAAFMKLINSLRQVAKTHDAGNKLGAELLVHLEKHNWELVGLRLMTMRVRFPEHADVKTAEAEIKTQVETFLATIAADFKGMRLGNVDESLRNPVSIHLIGPAMRTALSMCRTMVTASSNLRALKMTTSHNEGPAFAGYVLSEEFKKALDSVAEVVSVILFKPVPFIELKLLEGFRPGLFLARCFDGLRLSEGFGCQDFS